MKMNVAIPGLLVALFFFVTPTHAQAQQHSLTDLGTLGGATSKGYGINASGQVTGEAVTAKGIFHTFLLTLDSGMIDLGTLGGGTSSGYGINASGQVTGEAVTGRGVLHAFLYTPGGSRLLDLGTLGGNTSKGRGINASGQVTGEAVTADGVIHAFLYTPDSGMIDLGTLGGVPAVDTASTRAARSPAKRSRGAACCTRFYIRPAAVTCLILGRSAGTPARGAASTRAAR